MKLEGIRLSDIEDKKKGGGEEKDKYFINLNLLTWDPKKLISDTVEWRISEV